MTIYSFICTRDRNLSETTKDLILFYKACGIEVKLIIGAKSIFEGYQSTFDEVNPNPNDIIILCHDDIEILMSPKSFVSTLVSNMDTGFVGVAGSSYLRNDAIWWNRESWEAKELRGLVFHGKFCRDMSATYYGPYGPVVTMDGLFMAARAQCILNIGQLYKPSYFVGSWDFYDIYYSVTANNLGYKNIIIPIPIRHGSSGELVGRDSWHKNREAFISNFALPIRYKELLIKDLI